MYYSRTVESLPLADSGESPTSARRSASLTLAESTKIWLYVHACWLYWDEFWLSLQWLCWRLESVVSCCVLHRQTTNHCLYHYCCETVSGRICKVIWTVLVALLSFSLSTNHSLPHLNFLWHKESIMWTMYLRGIFLFCSYIV